MGDIDSQVKAFRDKLLLDKKEKEKREAKRMEEKRLRDESLHYTNLKRDLHNIYGIDSFYCVKKWSYGWHVEKYDDYGNVRNNIERDYKPSAGYLYTPLLCWFDELIEKQELRSDRDVSYEIMKEFSTVPLSVTIETMTTFRVFDRPDSSRLKSTLRMREYAKKYGETDEFEKLMKKMIERSKDSVLEAAKRCKDLFLCMQMMKIEDIPIDQEWIISIAIDFSDEKAMFIMIDRAVSYDEGHMNIELFHAFIVRAMKNNDDALLIHYMKKFKDISFGPHHHDDDATKIKYVSEILKKIDHPCIHEAYHDEFEKMKTLKRKKRDHDFDLTALQKKILQLKDMIDTDQNEIDRFLLTCPVCVRERLSTL